MNFDELLLEMEDPQSFSAVEINRVKKKPGEQKVQICLIFPDKYEIGMSHIGIKILYHLLNEMPEINAERCFLPSKHNISVLKKHKAPLFSLENKQPLQRFDLLAFSLLSEMNFTNILKVLELAGIPLLSKNRDGTFPLVAAGGISAVNPEPIRRFIDIFALGDGEVLFPEIVNLLLQHAADRSSRKSLLKTFSEIEGLYVPALVPVKKEGRFWTPQLGKDQLKKRVMRRFNHSQSLTDIIVPLGKTVFNRLDVELARGCPQNCRFCQAKSYYSPFRSKGLDVLTGQLEASLKATGFESFSLSSLSSGDYPQIDELLRLIPDIVDPGISFSISSLRPSTLSNELVRTISLFRRTGLTLVPEAGTERLRRVINKNVTEEEIFKAVELALDSGWEKIKLYFMIGLPGETLEDIDGIADLIERLGRTAWRKNRRVQINVSFSSFVPKPHTPFQWSRREGLDELSSKISRLNQRLKRHRRLKLDFHRAEKGVVETVLARGDDRVGDLLVAAYEQEEIFSAWDADFSYPVWDKLITRFDCSVFLTEFSTDETLPWEDMAVNYRKEYLLDEYSKAMDGERTPSCTDRECRLCPGCYFGKVEPMPGQPSAPVSKPPQRKPVAAPDVAFSKVRLFYEKTGEFRFLSHLSWMKYIERLIRRSGLRFKCTEGFHPRMKLSSLPALPVFAAGLNEVVELYIEAEISAEEIADRLHSMSPLLACKRALISTSPRPLSRDIQFLEYGFQFSIDFSDPGLLRELLSADDELNISSDGLRLRIYFPDRGEARFGKIYRTIDPEKRLTHHLTRLNVEFT